MTQCLICGTEEDEEKDFVCESCFDKNRELLDEDMR